jgi:hypothetical protein
LQSCHVVPLVVGDDVLHNLVRLWTNGRLSEMCGGDGAGGGGGGGGGGGSSSTGGRVWTLGDRKGGEVKRDGSPRGRGIYDRCFGKEGRISNFILVVCSRFFFGE